jgi:hypothetical protein
VILLFMFVREQPFALAALRAVAGLFDERITVVGLEH